MNYRLLPQTGWQVSEISYGCMSLGLDHNYNKKLLLQAVDKGINYFDTADLYDQGQNEVSLGKALKPMRKDLFIATKVGNQWRADGSGWDWNPRKEYILKAVEESLKRLQTDYIDLYQLHGGTIEDPMDETIEAFEILKSKGFIRHYGISSIRPNVIREYVKRSNLVSVMMQYSLLDRRPEESCLSFLADNNIGVIVRGGVAKGLLSGKPAQEYLNYSAAEVHRAAEGISAIASNQRSTSQTTLLFALVPEAVFSIAAGMRTGTQLQDNASTSEVTPLSASEMDQLRNLLPINVYHQHR